MRTRAFAWRNFLELLRDPMTIGFGIGFPLVLLGMMHVIQQHIPVSMFAIETLAPGIAAFGLTFIALFSATLIAQDRSGSLLLRLCATPMRARDFLLGYMLPLFPMAAMQMIVCYLAAGALGLLLNFNTLISMIALLPAAVLYIAIGLLCGILLNVRQVGGICGALLTNLCAWLSGIWFDISLLGDGFARVAQVLPFANAVDAARCAVTGDFEGMVWPMLIVCGYAIVVLWIAIRIFPRRLREGKM